MIYYLVSAIEWDTDGEKVDLPETIGVLIEDDDRGYDPETLADEILDQVSDNLEWCVNGCFMEEIDEADLPPVDFSFTLL